jgi:hypothetical protein
MEIPMIKAYAQNIVIEDEDEIIVFPWYKEINEKLRRNEHPKCLEVSEIIYLPETMAFKEKILLDHKNEFFKYHYWLIMQNMDLHADD